MASACARLLMAVTALRGGLDLTAVCHVVTFHGDQTVTALVCVGQMESAIRLMAVAFVFLATKALIVIRLVVLTAMVRTAPISAYVIPLPRPVVTLLMAPVTADQVSQDRCVISLALLAHGEWAVLNPVHAFMVLVTQLTESVPVIEDGKGCYATRLVPAVVSFAQDATMVTDHAIKPLENAFVILVTKEAHVWRLVV